MEKDQNVNSDRQLVPKKVYIQKVLFETKVKKTKVVNVKVKFLRELGYKDFKQWSQDPNNIYIGRNMSHYVPGTVSSKWANQFKVQQYGRDGCIQKYKQYILNNKQLIADLPQLKGKNLGCWCKPQACHGDVLVQLVEKFYEFISNKK